MISAKKSKHLIVVVVAALLPQWTNNATAYSANFGFSYSGAISAISPRYDPFGGGWTVNPPTPVYGHVLYDSTRPATDPIAGCDCMGYRQHIPGGFTAIVGHTIFRADDYVIQIKNDLAPPGGASQDTVSILWSSAFSPSLDSPLWVNGVPYTNALFQLNLDSANDTFSDSSLPPSLDLGRFASTVNFLDDNRSDSKFGAFFQWSALKPWAGPGDYNDSDSIDSDDYDAWREHFGSTTDFAQDGNFNGVVDAADYVLLRQNSTISSTSAAVPEPTGICLLVLACVALSPFRLTRSQCA